MMKNKIKKLALESNGHLYEYDVHYYWYHHMTFSFGEEALISEAIQNGDYLTFNTYYLHYGNDYFPQTATIYAGGEDIGAIRIDTPEGFALITYNECECG